MAPNRNVLNALFGASDDGKREAKYKQLYGDERCNLASLSDLKTEDEKSKWRNEKAKWTERANFTYTLRVTYNLNGLGDKIKNPGRD